MTFDVNNLIDAKAAWYEGGMNVALLNEGQVVYGEFPYRGDQDDVLSYADLDPVSFDGFVAMFPMTVPDYSPLYDRAHFELIISDDPDMVVGGVVDETLVRMRFYSEQATGWYIELDSVYDLPTAGANVESGSSQIGRTVKKIVANIDLDVSQPIYASWRPRMYSGGTLIYVGEFSGISIKMKKSLAGNTGSLTPDNQIVPLNFGGLTWPSGKSASFEVSISQKPYGAGADAITSRDSSINNSGFRYFDGDEMKLIPTTGIPYANIDSVRYFITNPVPSDRFLYVSYRIKWDVGNSAWATSIFMPFDTFAELGNSYTPSRTIQVAANELPNDYHVQVIAGLSNDLRDYFPSGDTTLPEPDLTYSGLFEYSYTYDITQRSRFTYFDDEFKNPSYQGFPASKDLSITYVSSAIHGTLDDMYVFWRFVHAPTFSSSSSQSSSSSGSSSSYSSSSYSSSSFSSSSNSSSNSSSSGSGSVSSSSSSISSSISSSLSNSSSSSGFSPSLICSGGTEPSVVITITAPDVSMPITWCGKTWVASDQPGVKSGQSQEICPASYTLDGTGSERQERWSAVNSSIFMWRDIFSFTWSGTGHSAERNIVQIKKSLGTYFIGGSYRYANVPSTSWLGTNNQPPSVVSASFGTANNYQITDNWFGSTLLNGVTYAWAKGTNW